MTASGPFQLKLFYNSVNSSTGLIFTEQLLGRDRGHLQFSQDEQILLTPKTFPKVMVMTLASKKFPKVMWEKLTVMLTH